MWGCIPVFRILPREGGKPRYNGVMSRFDRTALLLSFFAVLAAFWVSQHIFEGIPHLEDEMAYLWQARVYAQGKLSLETPPQPKSMLIPFVVDYRGRRFSKYPPGWATVLSFGVRADAAEWVNPLLAGFSVWLMYLLGKKVFDARVGLLAAFLAVCSPFFLLNAGSLLSHLWSLVLSEAFALSWLDSFAITGGNLPSRARRLAPLTAGISLGALALSRPLTAVGVASPFFLHGLILLIRGDWLTRRRVLLIGILAAGVASLLFVWQYALTGDFFKNPYTLWWAYDKVGFGEGVGRKPGGHSLYWAMVNLHADLRVGWSDLFGWRHVSWIFLPFGIWASRRNVAARLVGGVVLGLVTVYLAYWIGARLFGPRYYFEGLYSLTLLTSAGVFWLADETPRRARRFFRAGTAALVALLVGYTLAGYLPARLEGMKHLYGISRAQTLPFLTEEALAKTPALVVVHPQKTWTEYGGLLILEDPNLTTPFIFALSRGRAADEALREAYPSRHLYHYYADTPGVFYDAPR